MKNFSRIGKINVLVGALFIISGLLLFVQKFENEFVLKEQGIAIPFVTLGIALFISAFLLQKNDNKKSS
jgi:uncharacterized membrane protein HdeD (DUF308 family)